MPELSLIPDENRSRRRFCVRRGVQAENNQTPDHSRTFRMLASGKRTFIFCGLRSQNSDSYWRQSNMTILSIIMGIIMIFSGFSCMVSPLATFLATGYFLCIMMLFYGIVGLVRAFRRETDPLEIITSVLAIIAGLIALFRPGSSLVFDSMMINLTAAWFLVMGVVSIVVAFKLRRVVDYWWLGLISGILGVILGIYSFMHPSVVAVSSGILIGFHFIETGITMIVMAIMLKRAGNRIRE